MHEVPAITSSGEGLIHATLPLLVEEVFVFRSRDLLVIMEENLPSNYSRRYIKIIFRLQG